MIDFATLAATQRRAYRTREAMLRQQHAQASMSGKSAVRTVVATEKQGRFGKKQPLDQIAAIDSSEPYL